MAARNKNNAEVVSSALGKALKVLKANKAEKVFLTADEYIFLNESDVRAYVGKDGSYTTVTEDSKLDKTNPEEKTAVENKGKEESKADTQKSDKVIDEHKKTEE